MRPAWGSSSVVTRKKKIMKTALQVLRSRVIVSEGLPSMTTLLLLLMFLQWVESLFARTQITKSPLTHSFCFNRLYQEPLWFENDIGRIVTVTLIPSEYINIAHGNEWLTTTYKEILRYSFELRRLIYFFWWRELGNHKMSNEHATPSLRGN